MTPPAPPERPLVAEADFFLSELDAAYSTAPVFPLRDSQAASAITSRWNDLTNSFGSWGVSGPTDLPLASNPIDQGDFRVARRHPGLAFGRLPPSRRPTWPSGWVTSKRLRQSAS